MLLKNLWSLVAWITSNPEKAMGIVALAYCSAVVIASALLWKKERRDELTAQRQLSKLRLRQLSPRAKVTSPKAPGYPSKRVS